MRHKMQLGMSGSEHCSRQSWTVLEQLCSGELLLMTVSAMQMQQRELGIL